MIEQASCKLCSRELASYTASKLHDSLQLQQMAAKSRAALVARNATAFHREGLILLFHHLWHREPTGGLRRHHLINPAVVVLHFFLNSRNLKLLLLKITDVLFFF